MRDGSVCKAGFRCLAAGSVISNTECGGASSLTLKPGHDAPPGGDIAIHTIHFRCSSPTRAVNRTATATPLSSLRFLHPVNRRSTQQTCTRASSSPSAVPPAETAQSTSSSPCSHLGTSTSGTSARAATLLNHPSFPRLLPRCLSTRTQYTHCSNIANGACWCASDTFIADVISCLSAWGENDDETSLAVSYLTGMCALQGPLSSARVVAAPSTDLLQSSQSPSCPLVGYIGPSFSSLTDLNIISCLQVRLDQLRQSGGTRCHLPQPRPASWSSRSACRPRRGSLALQAAQFLALTVLCRLWALLSRSVLVVFRLLVTARSRGHLSRPRLLLSTQARQELHTTLPLMVPVFHMQPVARRSSYVSHRYFWACSSWRI